MGNSKGKSELDKLIIKYKDTERADQRRLEGGTGNKQKPKSRVTEFFRFIFPS